MTRRVVGWLTVGVLLLLPLVQDARATAFQPASPPTIASSVSEDLLVVATPGCALVTTTYALQIEGIAPSCRDVRACRVDAILTKVAFPCSLPDPLEPPCDPNPDPNAWDPANPSTLIQILHECCGPYDFSCMAITTGWLVRMYAEGHMDGVGDYCVGIDDTGQPVVRVGQTCTGSCTSCPLASSGGDDYVCASASVGGVPVVKPFCARFPTALALEVWTLAQSSSVAQEDLVVDAPLVRA
jgi:hypothetical protein